jgi:transcriptional regulator with XRE-family HTH domain
MTDSGRTFAERLKQLRKHLGLTQSQLADLLGVRQNTISRLESSQRRASSLLLTALERATNVSKQWLLTGEGPMFRSVAKVDLQDSLPIKDEGLELTITNVTTGETKTIIHQEIPPRLDISDPALLELMEKLKDWWENVSLEERHWLVVHLRHTVPGFEVKKRPRGRPRKTPPTEPKKTDS